MQSVVIDADLAILAVVGDGMAGMPGIAAKVFNALGATSVNVPPSPTAPRSASQRSWTGAMPRARCAPCSRASISRPTRTQWA